MASSSRARSSSPFGFRRPSPINGRITIPRYPPAALTSSSSSYGSGYAAPRSLTPSRVRSGDYSSNFRFGSDSLPELVTADTASSDSMDFQRNKENICVTIRFRPLSVREHHKGDEVAWYPDGDTLVRNEYNPSTAYAFDKVFGPATTTKGVYDVAARHVVRAAMEGVNGTVFAYGVTSSGKTHTMHGDQRSPGIIPLAIKDVFSIIQDTPGQEFLLRVSYLEIYNEVINDLLDPTGQNLRVREDVQGTYVEGIKEEVVLSPAHALSFIAAGEEHRHVGSNNFNLLSSRSHTIFTLTVESSVPGSDDEVTLSQLNLIDLAGSESSKTETTGLRRKEGSYINKSLLTLGTVIGKLSEGKASHIPYRDSKLTRLLQSSLSGHGHVSLICTITPASSNMEETHNTLKFAQRAKRVAIRAAPNRIIDEKSLIKKYQKEITILKHELDHLKKGILVTTSQEELITLRQQLEAGQVQMQSRLEEEEQAKAALMSRIQRLTKLILVSTKNTIPSNLPDNPSHQRRHSFGEDEKLDVLLESSAACAENETSSNESPASAALTLPLDLATEMKAGTRRSSSKRSDEQFPSIDSFVDSTQVGELFSGTVRGRKPPPTGTTMMDQMDLLTEQVKMLAGEVAFSSSSLKRLSEQAANNPEDDKIRAQMQKLEDEIEEKKRQMKVLEQRITGSSLAASNNASPVEMQQTIAKLMSQYNEKAFELEIKSADNRILQERLEAKESENKQLHETILSMRQQSSSASERSSQHENGCADELAERHSDGELLTDENRKRGNDEEWHGQILLQASEIEKLKQENVRLNEENGGLHIQSQKLSEEASYAKELASAAAVELKNLAEEVTRLSFQNAKLTKELAATQETLSARGSVKQGLGNGQRKSSESKIRKARAGNRTFEAGHGLYDEVDSWSLGVEDMKRELHARKEREAALEAALADKEQIEAEYQMKIDEAKRRETDLENDLAGMWVLVAKLKKEAVKNAEARIVGEVEHDRHSNGTREGLKVQGDDISVEEKKDADMLEQLRTSLEAEKKRGAEMASLISQLKSEDLDGLEISALENLQLLHAEALTKLLEAKAQMQEKLKKGTERESNGGNGNNNEETNAHVCKVCFEYATEAVLIPCRHFCLCKTCAVACTECPLCRTKIEDRIITFTS